MDSILEFSVDQDCNSNSVTVFWDFDELEAVIFVDEELLIELFAVFLESEVDFVQFT